MISFQVDGIQEAITRAEGLERAYLMVLNTHLSWFGETVTKAMQEGHPPGGPHPPPGVMPEYGEHAYIDRTGWLTRSVGFTVESWSSYHASVVVFALAPYSEHVEYGVPGHSRPYPFFWPNFFRFVPLLIDRLRVQVPLVFEAYADVQH